MSEGLGEGSPDLWLQKFDEAAAGREIGRELDRQYNSARSQVSQVFGRIDESLASSVVVLWGEIADAMREKRYGRAGAGCSRSVSAEMIKERPRTSAPPFP